MFLFGNSPGVVGTAVTEGALPFSLILQGVGPAPTFPTPGVVKAVLTGFRGSERSAVGLAPTLRDRIYVWLLGEKPGVATVSGFAFPALCGPESSATPWTGLDAVYSYFETSRATTFGAPTLLVFGLNAYRYGFLDEFDHELVDAETGVSSFQFRFKTLPKVQSAQGTVDRPIWLQ